MNIGVHTSFWVMFSSGYMPRIGIAESYNSSVFSLLRNLHAFLHSVCTNQHSHQQCRRVPFFPHPLQHLLFVDFFIMAILMSSVRWHLIVVWFAFSLIMSDTKHLFMFLLALRMSPLEKYLFRLFAHFLIQLFVFLLLSCMSCLYILEINPLSVISPILRVVFSPCL